MTVSRRKIGRTSAGLVTAVCLAGVCAALAQELPTATTGNAPSDYRIGPGDTLSIVVWRQPDLSVELPVRPDGMISIPLVDDMAAVGKTPTELQTDIEAVLAMYIRNPEVTVVVTDFVGVVGSQIRVTGEVVSPGSVPYREGITLLDVMFEAGGLTDFASGRRGRLIRTVDGETEELRVRIDRLLDGNIEENVRMQPGDIVIVPQARI